MSTGPRTVEYQNILARTAAAIPDSSALPPVMRKDFFVDPSVLAKPLTTIETVAAVEKEAGLAKAAADAAAVAAEADAAAPPVTLTATAAAGAAAEGDFTLALLQNAFGGDVEVYELLVFAPHDVDVDDADKVRKLLRIVSRAYAGAELLMVGIGNMVKLLGRMIPSEEYNHYMESTPEPTPAVVVNAQPQAAVVTPPRMVPTQPPDTFNTPVRGADGSVRELPKVGFAEFCKSTKLWRMDWVKDALESILLMRFVYLSAEPSNDTINVTCSSNKTGGDVYHYIFLYGGDSLVQIKQRQATNGLLTFNEIPARLKLAARACLLPPLAADEPDKTPDKTPGEEQDKTPGVGDGEKGRAINTSVQTDNATVAPTGIRLRLRRDRPLPACTVIV